MKFERAVRRWLLVALAALIVVPWSQPTQAQSDYRRYGLSVQQGDQRGDRGEYRDDRRRNREAAQRQQSDRTGSLTPDERRDLNRDLQRANREFYRKERERR